MSTGYFSIISSLLPSKPSQTAQLTALHKTTGFKRGAARPFVVIFGGLGGEAQRSGRRGHEREGNGDVVENKLDQPTKKKQKTIAKCVPPSDFKIGLGRCKYSTPKFSGYDPFSY
jgi:hypothetical protein